MIRVIGKCLNLIKQTTCKQCGSVLEYSQNDVVVGVEYETITCPCCGEKVIVWELKYEEKQVLQHSIKHINYVNSLKKDDPVIIWRGSLAGSEKLHFRFIDHRAGVPTIFTYPDGKTSHTCDNGNYWIGWCLYHDNYIVDLNLIKTQILKAHPILTCKERSLK